MANHLLINFVLVCLAATTISSYRLDEQAALKIRHARQCAKCPADSPELLSSPWSGAPQEKDQRSSRYDRATEVGESPTSEGESSTSGNSKEVRSSSSGIDLSQVTFGEYDKGDTKNSTKTKQRRHVPKYSSDDAALQRILVSSSTGNKDRMEGRTFVLRRVDGTMPTPVVEDQPTSSQTLKYFARFDRLLAIYEEIKKFREEYSKKTIYEYLESAIHHVFQTIIFDHLPSLLLASEAAVTDKVGKNSRNGKRNCEASSPSMYDSDETDDKQESSGGRISFPAAEDESAPEIMMQSEPKSAEILQYSQEPRALEAPESHSYEHSRDFEPNFHLGTVGTSGNRHFGSNIHDDSATYGTRQLTYGSLGEDAETARFPRQPIERFASKFHYRFPADATENEKTVYRRMAPIDNAKRAAKRETRDGRLPVPVNGRRGPGDLPNLANSEISEISVDPVGPPESATPKDHGKSARLARSAALEKVPDDAEKIEESEKSERFGASERSAIPGDHEKSENNGNIENSDGTTERIARAQVSAKLGGPDELKNLNEPGKSRKNETLRFPENNEELQESEEFFENPNNLDKIIYDELKKLEGTEELDDEDAKLISMLLERLKHLESDAGSYTEVEPAHITVVEKPSTIVTDRPKIDESPTDSPPPSTPV